MGNICQKRSANVRQRLNNCWLPQEQDPQESFDKNQKLLRDGDHEESKIALQLNLPPLI